MTSKGINKVATLKGTSKGKRNDLMDTEELNSRILTIDDLTRAIKNSIDKDGMEEDIARQMAHHIMNFFGFSDRIIDNVLEPEDRDAFYMLEDVDILTTEREETTLYDGREWRIHYWLFRRERVLELVAADKDREVGEVMNMEDVYKEIPENIWIRANGEEDIGDIIDEN